MNILDYSMGMKAAGSSGSGDSSDVIRFRKDVIASEQTVTVEDDEPALIINSDWLVGGEGSVAIKLEWYDLCLLTVNGTDYILNWGANDINDPDSDYVCTKPNNEDIEYEVYYDNEMYGFVANKNGTIVDGEYIVEFSKLVSVI